MFRHYDISHHHEAVALAGLFQDGEEAVAASSGTQKGQAVIAGARDKVQLIGAVVAMQAARHDKRYASSSVVAHPCKKRKDGEPAFCYGKTKELMCEGRATRPQVRMIFFGLTFSARTSSGVSASSIETASTATLPCANAE